MSQHQSPLNSHEAGDDYTPPQDLNNDDISSTTGNGCSSIEKSTLTNDIEEVFQPVEEVFQPVEEVFQPVEEVFQPVEEVFQPIIKPNYFGVRDASVSPVSSQPMSSIGLSSMSSGTPKLQYSNGNDNKRYQPMSPLLYKIPLIRHYGSVHSESQLECHPSPSAFMSPRYDATLEFHSLTHPSDTSLSRSILSYLAPSDVTSNRGSSPFSHLKSDSNRYSYGTPTIKTVGMTGGIMSSDFATFSGGVGGSCGDGPYSRFANAHCWFSPATTGVQPAARAAHSADVIGGNRIYVFGGWNGKKAMNDLYVIETDKMIWKEVILKNAPPERNNHTTAVVGHRLFVHGGHDGTKWLDDLYVLDAEALTWTEVIVTGKSPSARACHTLSRVNDKVYLFGGYDGQKCFNEIDILDLDTFSWIQPKVFGTQPQARNAHSMTVIDSKLFLFGGHSGNKHLTDLHVFDTITLRWTQPDVQGTPPPGLRGHTGTLIGERLFLFGGYDGKGRSNNLFILETTKLKWLHPQDSDGAPAGRQRHSACLVGAKRLFVFGGFDGIKWLNDLHILDVGRLTEDELTDSAVRMLINNLRKLVGETEFSDVTLIVDGHEIPAHRNILAAQCDYFKSMFSGQMKESREQKISISGWSYDPYIAMLEFLYTGRLSEAPHYVISDVMGLADQYGLDALKTLCENNLKHSVDNDNVCFVLRSADKYQAANLKSFCNNFIFKHADEVMKTKAFEELSSTPWLLMDITRLSLRSTFKTHRTLGTTISSDEGPGGI